MNTSTKNIFLIIGLMIITSISNIIQSQCNAGDFHALKELYDSTNGAGWTSVSGWELVANNATPPAVCDLGSMTGITVDGSNRVSEINLGDKTLVGTLPQELGDLSNLIELRLSSNELYGSIPSELGNLPNLTHLILNYNDLTGSIPSELGNLANLTMLWLDRNDLTGSIPPELGNLANLTELKLSSNDLTGSIPSELGNLANLTELSLSGNYLTGSIPSELGNLTNLTELTLNSNDLTGSIPSELGNLANLTELILNFNDLTGSIPPELGNLSNLTELHLSSNDLTGSIPSELGNLANLTKLILKINYLTGSIPSELGNLYNLSELQLHSNDLTGEIPESFGYLSSLDTLNLHENSGLSSTCYYPSLLNLCNQGIILDVTGTSLPDWDDWCNEIVPHCTNCSVFDMYWIGGSNNNWNKAINWNTGCIPTDIQIVHINTTNKLININSNVDAEARKIIISPSNTLNVKTSGELEVGPEFQISVIDTAIVNHGIIENKGSIAFNWVDDINIYNQGTLTNGTSDISSTGAITIDNTNNPSTKAIVNKTTIENYKTINITKGSAGIENDGTFLNYRDLNITAVNGTGIYNTGIFENNVNAALVSQGIVIHDLTGPDGNAINNLNTFKNYRKITIDNISKTGIITEGLFTNEKNIFISNTKHDGIWNKSGTFKNGLNQNSNALIELTDLNGFQSDGIYNDGFFENNGDIDVSNISKFGIINLNNFNNYNEISISGTSHDGIWNQAGDFINNANSTIYINDLIAVQSDGIYNEAEFNNIGDINITNVTKRGIINIDPDTGDAINTSFDNRGTMTLAGCGMHGVINYALMTLHSGSLMTVLDSGGIPFEMILGCEFTCDLGGVLDVQD